MERTPPESEHTSTSLMRCVLKKSANVTQKIVLFVSYIIVAIAIFGIVGYSIINGVWPLVVAAWTDIVVPAWNAFYTALASIPWYVYLILAIPVCIVGYSMAWCVARDLTEEDWASSEANAIAAFAIAAFAFTFAFAFAFTFTIAAIFAIAFALAFALAIAIFAITIFAIFAIAVAVDPVDKITVWYYIFRFFGAAWHHHKMKSKSTSDGEME